MNLCGNPPFLLDPLTAVKFNKTDIIEIKDKHITVFPNPTKGTFKIQVSQSINNYEIELLNPLGDIIYRKQNILDKVLSVNISEHAKGIYLLKVKTENGLFIKKIIKQ